MKKSVTIKVSPSVGNVAGEYIIPPDPVCILTLAHGAGAGINHVFMVTLSEALAEQKIATLRFNFPFSEQNKMRPDVPAVAHKAIEAAIEHAHKKFPSLPLFASGKSFGGRMSSQYVAATPNEIVKGIVFYGFPLHPAGKPSVERAEHLKGVKVPMLFLQGTRDTLATIDMMEDVCKSLKKATLIKIEGADHGFKAGKQDIIPVLAKHTAEWI